MTTATSGLNGTGAATAVAADRPRLLFGNPAFTASLVADIDAAQHVVNAEIYGLHDSGSGATITGAMKRAAARDVEVNLIVDSFGSRQLGSSPKALRFVGEMRDAGMSVIVNRRPNPHAIGTAPERLSAAYRDGRLGEELLRVARDVHGANGHRKHFGIDNLAGYDGGMNLSATWDTWNDIMVRYQGPAIRYGRELYLAHWTAVGGKVSERQAQLRAASMAQPVADAASGTRVLANLPPAGRFNATEQWFSEVANARQRFWTHTPFVTSPEMSGALVTALRERPNLDVRMLVPSSTAFPSFLLSLSKTHYRDLIEAGAKIYELPEFAHTKAWLADGRSTVSSLNMAHRSMSLDYEASVVMNDAVVGAQLAEHFERTMASSRQVKLSDLDSMLLRAATAARKAAHFRL